MMMMVDLEHCTNDVEIIIDGDLQHPTHLIPKMIETWEERYKRVNSGSLSL